MKSIDKRRIAEYLVGIVIIAGVLFVALNTSEAKKLVSYVLTILTPFIYGFCIAYVLNLLVKQIEPLFNKLDKKRGKESKPKTKRVWAIILSLLVFVLFAALTIGMIIPNLKNTISSLYKQAPELWDKVLAFLDSFKLKQPKLEPIITKLETSIGSYFDKLTGWFKNNWSDLVTSALSKLKSAGNVVVNLALGAVIAFGMLLYKELLVREVYMIMRRLLPTKYYGYFCYVQGLANKKFQIFLKYNVIQALITGAGTLLFMLVTNMPYKISITLLITVTQLIPIIGAIVGTVVSAILIAAVSPIKAIVFVVLCILVQQLVEKLINPHLMGKELEMPGLLTFIVICLGGKQFGLVGLICAVPVVSIFYDIYTLKIRPKLKAKDK
ncbi:MAG: AI-2E family transporter [Eubacterium sp.]|nr:AI-2E family transporter [Eubacterium sp.]